MDLFSPLRPFGLLLRERARRLEVPFPRAVRRWLFIGGLTLAGLAALWPVLVRAARVPTLADAVIWLAGLLTVAALLGAADLHQGHRRPAAPTERWLLTAGLVALPMALAALLTFPTLADPYFSAIGDEYAFWEFARALARGAPHDPFTQAGVYGNHPVLSSYLMAGTMRLLGPEQVGWRAASALSHVVAAGALTALGMLAFNRFAGLVAGVGLAAAHPLLAYAHTGYNNIQSVPLTILALVFGVASRRFGSLACAFVGGVFAGAGWYTFYTSRVAVVALLALLLLQPGRGRRMGQIFVALAGFALAVLPLVVASREQVILKMLAESAAAPAAGATTAAAVLARLLTLTAQAIRAPWAGDRTSHYISGPLLDPVSGVVVAAGAILGVLLVRRAPWRWLWVWYGLALLAGGATSQYDHLPNSRSFFFLPPLLLIGGLAAGKAWERVCRTRWTAVAFSAFALVLGVVVVALNLSRLHVETPRVLPLSAEAVAAMTSERHRCREAPAGPLFLADHPEPVFEKLVAASGWTERVEIRKMPSSLSARDLATGRCIIAFGSAAVAELQRLAAETGRIDQLVWATDGPGNRRAVLLRRTADDRSPPR
ncbi:MAG: glycosyltransferase family 39 protein [Chloroflexota bacterium]|nr:glycosyltransferase family 39 protein [Dehalococcoidia bacterium]MDW8252611.1 glycosyltransferase family 39 protein [Chloroflexota bacterium]